MFYEKELSFAYDRGYSDGHNDFSSSNPYDESEEYELWKSYEDGYSQGLSDYE